MTDDAKHAEYYTWVEKEGFRPLWTRLDRPGSHSYGRGSGGIGRHTIC